MAVRWALVSASIVLIATMFVLVPWLTKTMGPSAGYLTVFFIYWFGFCLPLGFLFQGQGAIQRLGLSVSDARWVPWAVAVQVALIVVVSYHLAPKTVTWVSIGLAVIFGTVNGFLEEFFWRGAYLAQGQGEPRFQALGLVLFSLWHVPLTLAHGVTYEGGTFALIGGAIGLGFFWTLIAYQTGRIGWAIISHALTNIATFVGLIATNFN
jgi:CAAX protease family protein